MTLYQEALDTLDALYAMIPRIACQGSCTWSCGPLALSYLERLRLQRTTGRKLQGVTSALCPLLKEGQCTAYGLRPLICRAWGAVESMACPYGCVPDRYLTVSELHALLHTVEEVSQTLFPRQGTCSLHADAVILQAQEQAAAHLCHDLWGVG